MNRAFLAPLQLQKQFVRTLLRQQPNKKHIYKKVGNGQRFGCITYYADEKVDPSTFPDPPKLFRVQRIKPLRFRNYWERRILKDLGLIYQLGTDVAVVKNTPENNVLLWKIKHLISVEPIVFPFGEPTDEDINHTRLKADGECIVHKKIGPEPERVKATEEFINDPVRLDKDTLKRDALLKWNRSY